MGRWIWLLAVPVLGGFTCGHPEAEGPYTFVGDQVISDPCGLLSNPAAVATGTLTVIGDNVREDDFTTAGVTLEMVGPFNQVSNDFEMDGSAENVALTVNGSSCTVDILQVHVTGVSDGGTGFSGALELTTQAMTHPTCQCAAQLTYHSVPQ